MSKEEALKQYKSLFPDNVEAIILTKEDYDRQLGQLQFENIILKDRIDKAIEYNKKVLTWTTNEEITDLIAYHNLNILNDEEIPIWFEGNDY